MQNFLSEYKERLFAFLRIVAGFLFFCHGAQKLLGVFGGNQAELMSLRGVAGVIEFVGGLLIMFGLFTGWAAFICSGQMAVAYFMAHQPNGILPIQNRGELAALYAWVFLYIAAHPVSCWSVDGWRKRKK